jgi:DNA-directed RNA polymerase subunit H (RpoH/RPB5)
MSTKIQSNIGLEAGKVIKVFTKGNLNFATIKTNMPIKKGDGYKLIDDNGIEVSGGKIENFENKNTEIQKLKTEYQKLVPENYIVYIEFEPESKILTTTEEITIKIYKLKDKNEKENENLEVIQRNDGLKVISQNWNLKPNSEELEKILKSIGWTNQTLSKIKKLLNEANCVSIENGKITTIGFAGSGMGKYSYKIFDKPLNEEEKAEYNNGCEYIFCKNNIVLEYGGGAIGPQCFERE